MADEMESELNRKRSELNSEAGKHRRERDRLNDKARGWIEKRDALNAKAKEFAERASDCKQKRDEYNLEVRKARLFLRPQVRHEGVLDEVVMGEFFHRHVCGRCCNAQAMLPQGTISVASMEKPVVEHNVFVEANVSVPFQARDVKGCIVYEGRPPAALTQ